MTDRDLRALIVVCGKFRYKTLPMGESVRCCELKARTDIVLLDLGNFQKSVDDLLGQWVRLGEMRMDVAVLLNRLMDQGMKLSLKKLKESGQVIFGGF